MTWTEGRRVVDLAVLAKCLRCKQCGELLDLEKTQSETRMGLASVLIISCYCGLMNAVHTSAQQYTPDGRQAYTINMNASRSLVQCGGLAYVIRNFFAALNIPLGPVSPIEDVPDNTDMSSYHANSLHETSPGGKWDSGLSSSTEITAFGTATQENGLCSIDTSRNLADEQQDLASDTQPQDTSDQNLHTDRMKNETATFTETKELLIHASENGFNVTASTEDVSASQPSGSTVDSASRKRNPRERVKVQNTAVIKNTASSEKPFGCGMCFKAFTTEELCRSHIENHINNKSFLCEECGKGFVCSYNLKLHMKQHTGERPHRCCLCGKDFIRESTLKRHLLKHKGLFTFTCEQCGESFSSQDSLRRHSRLHSGVKPFKCDQCDKEFRGESNLYAHRRRHFGIKPYKCTECEAAFVESTHLTRHKRTHTKEQPYVCEICGVRYTQSGTLAAHRKKHTGEPKTVKKLQCADCGKIFHSYTQLKRHKRVHSGERPFACDFCDMRFTQSSSLKAHRRIHTGDRPFSCEFCGESFLYLRTLKRHKKKHEDETAQVPSLTL